MVKNCEQHNTNTSTSAATPELNIEEISNFTKFSFPISTSISDMSSINSVFSNETQSPQSPSSTTNLLTSDCNYVYNKTNNVFNFGDFDTHVNGSDNEEPKVSHKRRRGKHSRSYSESISNEELNKILPEAKVSHISARSFSGFSVPKTFEVVELKKRQGFVMPMNAPQIDLANCEYANLRTEEKRKSGSIKTNFEVICEEEEE